MPLGKKGCPASRFSLIPFPEDSQLEHIGFRFFHGEHHFFLRNLSNVKSFVWNGPRKWTPKKIWAPLCGSLLLASGCMQQAGSASSGKFIQCTQPNSEKIVNIEIAARLFQGSSLNCISGDFVVDMSGCAPDGGYGLHISTGSAALERVVMRWQDYTDHFGGVVSNSVSPTQIRFTGGFHFPGSGYREKWSFSIDRLTGLGALRQDNRETSFICQQQSQILLGQCGAWVLLWL